MEKFQIIRTKRTRRNALLRNLVAQTVICPSQLILPIFVKDDDSKADEVQTMKNIHRYNLNEICNLIDNAKNFGINAFTLFPCVKRDLKTHNAQEAYNPNNLVCRAIKKIKSHFADEALLIADVALDPYTISGHDGILQDDKILNDKTLEALCKQSLVLAASGADIIAPSDMMDGRIGSIRYALDIANFQNVVILSYAAKYASCLYFPFRDAIGSSVRSQLPDKKTYQLDYKNHNEAIKEISQDIKEGADVVMVKPAILYLDIIKSASQLFDVPVFAYQVSGEYQMLMQSGGIDLLLESLIAIKRAGATSIFTYAAIEVAKILKSI